MGGSRRAKRPAAINANCIQIQGLLRTGNAGRVKRSRIGEIKALGIPMNQAFKIENHVPMPKPGDGKRKYPWAQLELGQSFLIPCDTWEREGVQFSLTSCRRGAEKTGKKFATRQVDGGVRVWRVK
jgi:hypothetical protein